MLPPRAPAPPMARPPVLDPIAAAGAPRTGRLARALATAPLALAAAVAGGAFALDSGAGVAPRGGPPEAVVAAALGGLGFGCAPEDVVLVPDEPRLLAALVPRARAIARVRRPGGTAADLVLLRLRVTPEGRPLGVAAVHDLTATPDLDEGRPIVAGHLAAYLTHAEGAVTSAVGVDLDGDPRGLPPDLGRVERAQLTITALQEAGQRRRPHRTVAVLDPSAQGASLALEGSRVVVVADGRRVALDLAAGTLVDGEDRARVTSDAVVRPASLVPWAVDRVRATSFGDERMQAVKALAYTVKDRFARLLPDKGEGATADDVKSDLGDVGAAASAALADDPAAAAAAEAIGWPPASLDPPLTPALPGEGAWIALEGDPFLPDFPGVPTPLVTTFVRTDPERKDARVYVTLWDARVVELHMEAGTIEPVSATGEVGRGEIPRAPEVLERVVGAFNGGFQATHGEYGMQAEGVLLLPPKPYGATVFELDDGRAAFGTWPPGAPVPPGVRGFRQNMTALVEDGRYNPWGRTWWGGTPPGYADTIHTTRSGLCATREGHVAYFFGHELSPDALGRGMLAARCRYGMHLDMNVGHVGFEYLRIARTLPPLGRPLQKDWEAEGAVRDAPGYRYRARRMVRSTGHMSFPRYVGRDGRDFFWLARRHVLPRGEGGEGSDRSGYPAAYARAQDGAGPDGRPRTTRLDPRVLAVAAAAGGAGSAGGASDARRAPLVRVEARARGNVVAPRERVLVLVDGRAFEAKAEAPVDGSVLFEGVAPTSTWAARARLGACVEDLTGHVLVVETEPGRLAAALRAAGCRDGVVPTRETRLVLGPGTSGSTDGGAPDEAASVALVRADRPPVAQVLPDVPFVPVAVWHPEMLKRPKLPPRSAAPR